MAPTPDLAVVEPTTRDEEGALAVLRQRFPQSQTSELLRFARARPRSVKEACDLYQAHLEWRTGPGEAGRLADAARAVPAKFVRAAGEALDGSAVLVVQGARYDLSLEPEQYVLAAAAALDAMGDCKVTVLLDVRPGDGWPNEPVTKMWPLVRAFARTLPNNYPERLQCFIVYPVPDFLRHLWWAFSRLLEPRIRNKFVVLSGEAGLGAPSPDALSTYVAPDQLPADHRASHQAMELGLEPALKPAMEPAQEPAQDSDDGMQSFCSAHSQEEEEADEERQLLPEPVPEPEPTLPRPKSGSGEPQPERPCMRCCRRRERSREFSDKEFEAV